MRWLGRIVNFPAVLFKHLALVFWQTTLWIVEDQTRAQWRERCVDMDRIRITRKIHSVDAVFGEVTAQPFDSLQVCRESMLHNQVAPKTQHVRCIKQGFFFGCDKELLSRPLQAFGVTDLVAQVIRMVVLSLIHI